MSNEIKLVTGITVITIALVVAGALLFGNKVASDTKTITADQQKKLVAKTSQVKGAKDAKIVLVEFGDFECPACAKSHPIIKKIVEDYNGKVTYVFRQFPLPMHRYSKKAAVASEAAGEQGKFFAMQDMLYENHDEWVESNDPLPYFEKYAEKLKLDMTKFKKDIRSSKYDEKINKDIADGTALQIEATPTFFINNKKLTGGLPYDEFKAQIDQVSK